MSLEEPTFEAGGHAGATELTEGALEFGGLLTAFDVFTSARLARDPSLRDLLGHGLMR